MHLQMVSIDLEICTVKSHLLGGYFIPMSVARNLAADLGLSVGDDTIIVNAYLQRVQWLAGQ